MRKSEDLWKCIIVYVEDLVFGLRETAAFTKLLINKYKYKVKRTGSMLFHFVSYYLRDYDGTLCMESKNYVEMMIHGYEHMFGENRKIIISNYPFLYFSCSFFVFGQQKWI